MVKECFNLADDPIVSGCSSYNVFSFGLSVDLIVNDKAGSVWLVNFGCTRIQSGGGVAHWTETWLAFSDLKPNAKLFDCCFPLAPP